MPDEQQTEGEPHPTTRVGSRKESVPPGTSTESGRTPVVRESSSSLDRYQPRHVVAVTINATVTVDADSEVSATERVQYLIDGVAYSGQTDHDHLEVELDAIDVEARY